MRTWMLEEREAGRRGERQEEKDKVREKKIPRSIAKPVAQNLSHFCGIRNTY